MKVSGAQLKNGYRIPDVGPEEFRACCDWGNWVFSFDDMFDNGRLKDDPVGCRDMVDRLPIRLQEENENKESNDELPVIRTFKLVLTKAKQRSSTGVQRRYAKWMHEYANGALDQVVTVSSKNPSYFGGSSRYATRFSRCSAVICPGRKEGVEHNLISVCRNAGMSAQAAFDNVGELAKERYQQFSIALAKLPSWGQEIDEQVQQYIDRVRRVAQANLVWRYPWMFKGIPRRHGNKTLTELFQISFKSGRYFGSEVETISATRTIYVSPLKAELDEITARGKATEVM
ncbi:terpene cyclase [Penicillium malachiteum]|nr:terpene cyclase [Penicillium malachiteum]